LDLFCCNVKHAFQSVIFTNGNLALLTKVIKQKFRFFRKKVEYRPINDRSSLKTVA